MQELDSGLLIDVQLPLLKVKEHFIETFPYLKISFFKNGVEINAVHEKLPIASIIQKNKSESFQVYEYMSVEDVVGLIWSKLGLQVVIFRKLGKNLVETTFTSKWTLKRQNSVGSQIYFDD